MEERYCDIKELELYFHIPFCVRKCFYCDFLSAPGDEKVKRKYMKALLTETVGSAFRYADYEVVSIFIGGGTPSTVPADCLEQLMEAVRMHYRLADGAEVTMEVNPGTVSGEALLRFRRAGINRLSIGLQSADEEELKAIGRIHTWQQFLESYAAARRAGFDNVNVDIMSTLPGQTLSGYRGTLHKVLSLEPPPEHISAYSLILEEGTVLSEKYEKGELTLPDEDTDREMYRETKEILAQAGYERYEISNYAKKGYECRHNCGYWKRKNYAGFGIGAASLVENVRFHNGTDLKAYLAEPLGCREEIQRLGEQEQMEEFLFLGLRMTEGVSCREFTRLFGCSMEDIYGEVIRKNIRDGLLWYRPGPGEIHMRNGRCKADGKYTDSGRDAESPGSGEDAELSVTCQDAESPGSGQDTKSSGSGQDTEPSGSGQDTEPSGSGQDTKSLGSSQDMKSLGSNQDAESPGSGQGMEPSGSGKHAGDITACDRFLALTDRGLDVSNYVMAQFLL